MAISLDTVRQKPKQITGLGTFQVIGFNLNKEQLKALGYNKEDEVNYIEDCEVEQAKPDLTKDNLTVKRVRLEIWLKNTDVTVKESYKLHGNINHRLIDNPCKDRYYKISFYIEDREWTTINNKIKSVEQFDENGQPILSFKQQFLNRVGRTCWASRLAAIKDEVNKGDLFIKAKPIYAAKKGLDILYKFLQVWTRIDIFNESSNLLLGKDENSINELFAKNDNEIIKELNDLCKVLKKHRVKALVGIDGQWDKVFAKGVLGEVFGKNDTDRLLKEACSEHGLNADFQNDLTLKVFQPILEEEGEEDEESSEGIETDDTVEPANSNESTNYKESLDLTSNSTSTTPVEDDLPF